MDNIITIAEGYGNLARKAVGMPNEEVELMCVLRERLCNGCVDRGNPVLVEGKCTKCGCVMAAKWRATSSTCPLGKW